MATPISFPPFPFPTRLVPNPVTASVGTTPTLVFRNNPDRVFWLASNTSANIMYIGFGSDVSATTALQLNALGGGASMSYAEDGDEVGHEAWMVATGAGSTLYSFEIERSHVFSARVPAKKVA